MQELFRFLIIENSMASRIVIREQFARLNQVVDLVTTMEDALDSIASTFYDMILIDIGFYHSLATIDFKSLISEQYKKPPRPLMGILTNNGIDLYHQKSLDGYHYFDKPFSPEKTTKILAYLEASLSSSSE